jgi:hypothetical protein
MVHPHRRGGEGARGGPRQPEDPHRRGRGLHPRPRGAGRGRGAAAHRLRGSGVSRGDAAALPLPRSSPRGAPCQHDAALRRGGGPAQADVGARVHRVPDADHHGFVSRRRARLPRALAASSGQVLRAAAGAAAVQAADHGGGLRPLLPDRALLPRRGPACRPLAHRLLPARPRDELRHAGGRLRGDPAGDPGGVRGLRGRPPRGRGLAAHLLCRCRALVRDRQARPAQPDQDGAGERAFPRLGLRGLREASRAGGDRGPRDPGEGRRQPGLLRPDERLGAEGGAAGDGLHLLAARRAGAGGGGAGGQEHRARADRGDPHAARASDRATPRSSWRAGPRPSRRWRGGRAR